MIVLRDNVEEITMERNNLHEENSSLVKKLDEEKELKSGLEKIILGAADALNKVLSVSLIYAFMRPLNRPTNGLYLKLEENILRMFFQSNHPCSGYDC